MSRSDEEPRCFDHGYRQFSLRILRLADTSISCSAEIKGHNFFVIGRTEQEAINEAMDRIDDYWLIKAREEEIFDNDMLQDKGE